MITTWFLFVVTFCLGYWLGGKGKVIAQEVQETISSILSKEDKPVPGVVRPLTPEEIKDKHDPLKQGNKKAFDRFFKNFPKP